MSDCMTFPDTLDEFLEQYQFKDEKEVYTNGSMLIPVFRVKQWAEHIPAVDAVEVCRCSQCEFTETDCADAIYCQRWDRWEMPPDGYCAWGQRREDGDA